MVHPSPPGFNTSVVPITKPLWHVWLPLAKAGVEVEPSPLSLYSAICLPLAGLSALSLPHALPLPIVLPLLLPLLLLFLLWCLSLSPRGLCPTVLAGCCSSCSRSWPLLLLALGLTRALLLGHPAQNAC